MNDELLQLIGLLGLGLVLGLKHALDADHVVAVSTIVSQTKELKRSSLYGILWGLGHTTTLLISGLAILLLKLTIPSKLALSFEFIVGIVLVILGIDVLVKLWRDKPHLHKHQHEEGELVHTHIHTHKASEFHSHTHKSFLIGMLHGLAGSGSLVLLALASAHSVGQGILFILIFGIGSIIGMLITSTIIGLPFVLTMRFDSVNKVVRLVAGVVSVGLGIVVMLEVGIMGGLFAS